VTDLVVRPIVCSAISLISERRRIRRVLLPDEAIDRIEHYCYESHIAVERDDMDPRDVGGWNSQHVWLSEIVSAFEKVIRQCKQREHAPQPTSLRACERGSAQCTKKCRPVTARISGAFFRLQGTAAMTWPRPR
jgi:hypothetical protein